MTNVQPASVSCQTSGEYLQEGQDFEIELNKKNKEIDRLEIKWKEEKVDVQKKDLIIGGINEKLQVLEARLDQVENERKQLNDRLGSCSKKNALKMAEIAKERQNISLSSDMPDLSFTTIPAWQGMSLYKQLEMMEENLKELLAAKDKPKIQKMKRSR